MLFQLHVEKPSVLDQNTKERRARRGVAVNYGANGFLVNATTGVGLVTPFIEIMAARAKGA